MLYQLRSNSNVGSEQWVATNWRWRKQFEESGGVEVDNTDVLLVFFLCVPTNVVKEEYLVWS